MHVRETQDPAAGGASTAFDSRARNIRENTRAPHPRLPRPRSRLPLTRPNPPGSTDTRYSRGRFARPPLTFPLQNLAVAREHDAIKTHERGRNKSQGQPACRAGAFIVST